MDNLSAGDKRRVDDLVTSLLTVRDGDKPVMSAVLPEIRSVLGAEMASAYSLRQEKSRLALDFCFTTGEVPKLPADFEEKLQEPSRPPVSYDPLRPESYQRNRVLNLDHERFQPRVREFWARHGLARHNQLRVLLCEGPTLLAWVGGFRREAFGPRETGILNTLMPALHRRLMMERQLSASSAAVHLLGAALEAVAAPAFILRGSDVLHANSAGRALVDRDRNETMVALQEHVAGRRQDAFALTRHGSAGMPEHILAVARRQPVDAGMKACVLARKWSLTARQTEVLALVARGRSNKAIAAELRCSESTVEFHLTALHSKAGCETRAELVAAFWTQA